MDKEFYTAKEIIMGTRSEYQKIQRYVRMLEKMVYSDDKQVKNFFFNIFKFAGYGNPEIVCYFIQNEKTLRGYIWKLKSKLGTYVYGVNHNEIKKDSNGKYVIGNAFYDAYIKDGMEENFDLLAQKIFNSDFVTKMNFSGVSKMGIPEDIYMLLELHRISVHLCSNFDKSKLTWLDYIASSDFLYATRRDKDFDDETIYRMLNFLVPSDSLSDYHRQLIDNNPSAYKPIEICTLDEDIDRRNFNLLIDETEEKIILTKTKIRKI